MAEQVVDVEQLRADVKRLRDELRLLRQEMETHRRSGAAHPYQPHYRFHDSGDRGPFLLIPIYNGTPDDFADNAMFYDSSDNKLKIRVSGSTKSSGAFS